MKFLMYVLKDVESSEYGKITLFENEKQAVRFYCQFLIQNKLEKIKQKFSLKLVGVYNSTNGEVENKDLKEKEIDLITSDLVDLDNLTLKSVVELKEDKQDD